jgi:transposase
VSSCQAHDAIIAELRLLVLKQAAEISRLTARVAELEARLNQNSRNSSKPPSSDGPGAEPRRKVPSGKKRGGQEGHEMKIRALLPPDRIIRIRPRHCQGCQAKLPRKSDLHTTYQVLELPKVKPHVTQYHLFEEHCPECDLISRGELPSHVRGEHGPRLMAAVTLLTGRFRLSKREVPELMRELLGVPMASGTVCKIEQTMSEALAAPYEEALEYVRRQPVKHMDETGMRENKQKAWLWAMIGGMVAVFHVNRSRGGAVARSLLQNVVGTVCSDRYGAYNWISLRRRQLCWSHLMRDFLGMLDRPRSKKLGTLLYIQSLELFSLWHRIRDGTLTRRQFQHKMRPIQAEVARLLRLAAVCEDNKTRGIAKDILKLEVALWTFVRIENIEPTNNLAERAIRPAVLWRKGSFGTDSERGSRYMERMFTVAASCRIQERSVYEFLTQAAESLLAATRPPSLLPTAA